MGYGSVIIMDVYWSKSDSYHVSEEKKYKTDDKKKYLNDSLCIWCGNIRNILVYKDYERNTFILYVGEDHFIFVYFIYVIVRIRNL